MGEGKGGKVGERERRASKRGDEEAKKSTEEADKQGKEGRDRARAT